MNYFNTDNRRTLLILFIRLSFLYIIIAPFQHLVDINTELKISFLTALTFFMSVVGIIILFQNQNDNKYLFFLILLPFGTVFHKGGFKDIINIYLFFIFFECWKGIIKEINVGIYLKNLNKYLLIIGILHLFVYLFGILFQENLLSQYFGIFETRQISAKYFLVFTPIILYSSFRKTGKHNWFFVFILIISIVLTEYRTVFLTLAVILFYILFKLYGKNIIVFAGLILIVLVFNSHIFEKTLNELSWLIKGEYSALGSGRIGIIMLGLKLFINEFNWIQKLIGNGVGYSYYIHEAIVGYKSYAHSQFIQILIDQGILRLLLIMLFFVNLISKSWGLFNKYSLNFDILFLYALIFIIEFIYSMPLDIGGLNLFSALTFVLLDQFRHLKVS